MNKSESITKLAVALAKFQGEVKNPSNTATNPFFHSKYAPLETVLNTVRPLLSKHGLSIVQAPSTSEGYIDITTTLIHESGEYMEFPPLSLKMDKVTAQGAGSSITYARRYALSAILGISSEDDDDGNIAEKNSKAAGTPNSNNKGEKPKIGQAKALSDAQIKRLFAIGFSAGFETDTVKDQVRRKYNKDVENLTKAEYDNVCEGYEKLKETKESMK